MDFLTEPIRSLLFTWFELPERYFAQRRLRFDIIFDDVVAVAREHGRYAAIAEYRRQTNYSLDRCRIDTYRVLRLKGLWRAAEPSVAFPHSVDWEQFCCRAWIRATWMMIGIVSLAAGFYSAMAVDHWLSPDAVDHSG